MLPIVTIEGRVVADPELKFSASGMAVTRIRLVASKRKQNSEGEWVDDKTLWINATCFKQLAENVAESIAKGDIVVAVGSLQTDNWETAEGEKRSAIVLVANSISASLQFRTISHGGRAERSSGRSESAAPASSSEPTSDPWANSSGSDEPPF